MTSSEIGRQLINVSDNDHNGFILCPRGLPDHLLCGLSACCHQACYDRTANPEDSVISWPVYSLSISFLVLLSTSVWHDFSNLLIGVLQFFMVSTLTARKYDFLWKGYYQSHERWGYQLYWFAVLLFLTDLLAPTLYFFVLWVCVSLWFCVCAIDSLNLNPHSNLIVLGLVPNFSL